MKTGNSPIRVSGNKLMEKLIHSEYSFAHWILPGSSKRNLIVSLSSPAKANTEITRLDSGFLINRFNESHPVKPIHIKADLIIKEDDSIAVDPRINSNQLEEFEQKIEGNSFEPSRQTSKAIRKERSSNFLEIVEKAIEQIKLKNLEKVVLSRFEDFQLPQGFSIPGLFNKLCDSYQNAFRSMVHVPNEGIWVGVSPELLISNNSSHFKTIALAGTKKLINERALSEIAWTQKEIEEQAFVSRYIINCFKTIRLREFHEHGPKTIQAGNLAHLKTEFDVNLNDILFEDLANQMLELLHPTSAVCGMPLDSAKAFIEENEGYDRSFYAGFLGPVNFNESTNLFVNLRCMNVVGSTARLYAGAGITEDSSPAKELEETELKIETLVRIMGL